MDSIPKSNLVPTQVIRDALETLTSDIGLPVTLWSAGGLPLTGTTCLSGLCQAMLEVAPDHCHRSALVASQRALRSGRPEFSRCHAGLTYAALPVIPPEGPPAVLLIGGVATSPADEVSARSALARHSGGNYLGARPAEPHLIIRPRADLERWLPLCSAMAALIAQAVGRNAGPEAKSRPSNRTFEPLSVVAAAVEAQAPREFLEPVVRRLASFPGVMVGAAIVMDERRGRLRWEVVCGPPRDRLEGLETEVGDGFAGWTARVGKPLVITNPVADPRSALMRRLGLYLTALATHPFEAGGQVAGVLLVGSTSHPQLEAGVLQELAAMGRLSGLAATVCGLKAGSGEQSRRVRALLETIRLFNEPLSLKDKLVRLVDTTTNLFDLRACCISTPTEVEGTLRVRAARGLPPVQLPVVRTLTAGAAPSSLIRTLAGGEWATLADFPFGGGGEADGSLSVGDRDRVLASDQEAVLQAFAAIAGAHIAADNHRAEQDVLVEEVLTAFGMVLQARDVAEYEHARQVADHCEMMATALQLPPDAVTDIRRAGFLHDIGKLAVPAPLVQKAANLSSQEMMLLRRHPLIGAAIVGSFAVLGRLTPSVRHHHERYDGKGYPQGLGGHEIPLGSRIISIAEVFDGMLRDQPYRPGRSISEALAELRLQAGTQFDPELVSLFARHWETQTVTRDAGPAVGEFTQAASLLPELTSRELEVLTLLGRGLTNQELAETLQLSTKTVKTHVSSILQKLQLSDRTKAAVFAIERGLTATVPRS